MTSPTSSGPVHVKRSAAAPPGLFALEAAGLAWLDQGPVRCAPVLDVRRDALTLGRVRSARATGAAAEAFGADLARTHDLGAPGWGAAPPVPAHAAEWTEPDQLWEHGWFGPLEQPLPMPLGPSSAPGPWASWGAFHADRLAVLSARLEADAAPAGTLRALEEALRAGALEDDDHPVRAHGDLWNGNVMWDARGAVLIDPAARGDHREQDLAMLALFGAPHLDRILEGYRAVHPLRDGWRERIDLHQVFPLAAHAVLFDPPGGGGYLAQTERAAGAALRMARS